MAGGFGVRRSGSDRIADFNCKAQTQFLKNGGQAERSESQILEGHAKGRRPSCPYVKSAVRLGDSASQ
ncbi:MAG: hypothetical protein OXH50_07830, partial [Gemmatimonadetes bacterium]|nr:hypothetical protein [Gemmatimonadota bacterium]